MEPGEYLAAVRRRWPVVVVIVALAAGLGWISAPGSRPTAQYKATAVVGVRSAQSAAVALEPINPTIVAAQATSRNVAARAKDILKFKGSPEQLASQIDAKGDTKGNSVTISSTKPDSQAAVKTSNAFATALVSYLRQRQEQQVQAAVDTATRELTELNDRAATLDNELATADHDQQLILRTERENVTRDITLAQARVHRYDNFRGPGGARVTMVRDASPLQVSKSLGPPSSPLARAAIGAGLGLVLGIGLALFLDRLDAALRTRKQAEAAYGFPVVAEIPAARGSGPRVEVAANPRSAVAEAYRTLRTATLFMPPSGGVPGTSENGSHPTGPGGRVIVVTSPGPGEGKTSSAANLAAAFAETGRTVLVVGADLRRPELARLLGLDEAPGITDVLLRPGTHLEDVVRETSIPGLSILASGEPVENPAAALAGQRDLVARCRALAEIVVVDTPPLLVANDAVESLVAADAVVLVGRLGRTTADAARRAADVLHRLNAPVLGVALIGGSPAPRSFGRYYRSRRAPAQVRRRVGRRARTPDAGTTVVRPRLVPPAPVGESPTRAS